MTLDDALADALSRPSALPTQVREAKRIHAAFVAAHANLARQAAILSDHGLEPESHWMRLKADIVHTEGVRRLLAIGAPVKA